MLELDTATINTAVKCTKNHSCLDSGQGPMCRISDAVGGSIFFTCGESPNSCTYQSSFGYSFMCTCPVRQEIYRKYKI